MSLRYDNSTQIVPLQQFTPLLRDEVPYYQNLNRAPKNAYDYADTINKILSYGGSVSVLKTQVDPSVHYFSLLEIARIDDSEMLIPADSADPTNSRYGIVVTEMDDFGNIIVCTFCPNFVYPSGNLPDGLNYSSTGSSTSLYLNSANTGFIAGVHDTPPYLSESASGISGQISFVPIAKITGPTSIFFSGTLRSLTA